MAKAVISNGLTITIPDVEDIGIGRLSNVMESAFLDTAVQISATELTELTRALAPKKTGLLRSGIVVKPGAENSAKRGKVVYDIWINPSLNSRFTKYSGKTRYYYPASMEYGFRVLRKGAEVKLDGFHYMRNAARAYSKTHERRIASSVEAAISKQMK